MRKKLLQLTALLCLSITNVLAETRIMVISDPHLLPKEYVGALDSLGDNKLSAYSTEILNKAIDNTIEIKPDLLLVCGDMTFYGEKSGHELTHSILKRAIDAGVPVKVIPGNHDIMNPLSLDENNANVTPEEFASIYKDMGYESGITRESNSLSWATTINDKLAIIGLDANIYDGKEYYGDGCIRKSTLNWMKDQAAAFQKEGKMVIAMVHEEIMDHFSREVTFMGFTMNVQQSTALPKTVLNINHKHNPTVEEGIDAEDVSLKEVQTAFADAGIHYVLTGHFHVHNAAMKTVKKSDGSEFELYDLSTGGLTSYPCWMRSVIIDEDEKTVNTTSSLLEMPLDNGGSNLQSKAKEAISIMDADYEAYGFSISGLIEEFMGQENYELYDATEIYHNNENFNFQNITYTRFFEDNDWHILYLPYSYEYSDWSENFDIAYNVGGNDSCLYFETISNTYESVMPFTMALIRLKPGKEPGRYSMRTDHTNLQEGYSSDVFGELEVRGNYLNLTSKELEEGPYYTLNHGQFKPVSISPDSDSVVIKPMRWYLDASRTPINHEAISVYVDNEKITSDVKLISSSKLKNGKIYRIDGSEVKGDGDLPHGVYIKNGEKIVR